MAIDTAEKRRCVAGNMPTPDGTISAFDRRQVAGNYRGIAIGIPLGGTLAPSGGLTSILTAYRSLGGVLTPSGDLDHILTAYRSLGGTLSPAGDLDASPIFVVGLDGVVYLSGATAYRNPAWMVLDEYLRWMGEWDAEYGYTTFDTVLYRGADTEEWHVFVSKTTHNVGNVPDTSSAYWRRLYQEQWL